MNAVTKAEGKAAPVEFETPDQAEAGNNVPGPAEQPAARPKKKRTSMRVLLVVLVPAAMIVGGGYYWVTGGRFQETENAYLQQPKVSIASQISGRVIDTRVFDNMHVEAGDVLFQVDPEPYRIALSQAEAALAAARIQVEQLRAAYSEALVQDSDARSEVDYLETQLQRQQDLSRKGVTSQSALDDAQRALQKGEEARNAADQGVASALAALGGDPEIATDRHPDVLAALAARDKARYELQQTVVKAPAAGVVSQASDFRAGRYVGAGTALFSLVETQDSWVEANFKETQLTHMAAGQEAEVTFDAFPDRTIKATVDDIGAGTGAEFSLLPAQNATGNWVKVTQRVPVRLKLDTASLDVPLRTGMSATASVDTEVVRGFAGLLGGTTAHAAQ